MKAHITVPLFTAVSNNTWKHLTLCRPGKPLKAEVKKGNLKEEWPYTWMKFNVLYTIHLVKTEIICMPASPWTVLGEHLQVVHELQINESWVCVNSDPNLLDTVAGIWKNKSIKYANISQEMLVLEVLNLTCLQVQWSTFYFINLFSILKYHTVRSVIRIMGWTLHRKLNLGKNNDTVKCGVNFIFSAYITKFIEVTQRIH